VLCKAVVRQGARRLLTIGDGTVEYNDAFRLYLTTKLPNPHYPPEVCAPPPRGPAPLPRAWVRSLPATLTLAVPEFSRAGFIRSESD